MNILMMTNTYLPHVGGVARSVQTFSEEYRKLGHNVLVVAPEFTELGGAVPDGDERFVVRLPAIQKFNGSDFSVGLPLLAGFDDRLTEFEPDIVHAHHPFLVGDTALRFAAGKGLPVVFTHHTLYEQYTHYVPFDSPGLKHFVIELSTRFANICDGVIAPSESIAELIRERGVESPIRVVPTGIDLVAFAGGNGDTIRKSRGIPANALVIGHVGRLAPEKNLEFLARSVSGFMVDHPDSHFLVVGAGPSAGTIRKVFERAGLAERLHLIGKQSGQALYDAYGAMNVFAFSSRSETQGMVLAEAMAAGLPVVALDASGVREVLRDGANGIQLPGDASPADFSRALATLAKDENRASMRRSARETARGFSKEHCAGLAIAYYESLIRRSDRERSYDDDGDFSELLNRIDVEWELISGKAESAINALFSDEDEDDGEDPGEDADDGNGDDVFEDRSGKRGTPKKP